MREDTALYKKHQMQKMVFMQGQAVNAVNDAINQAIFEKGKEIVMHQHTNE